MDIALPALTIFIIVLPGIIFKKFLGRNKLSFYRTIASLSDVKGETSIVNTVLWSLVPALGIHAIGVWACSFSSYTTVRFDILGYLLSGPDSDQAIRDTFAALENSYGRILSYFAVVCVLIAVLGTFASWMVVYLRLDMRLPKIFKLNQWYYYLSGDVLQLSNPGSKEEVDIVVADVLTSSGDGNILYSGIINWYELSDNGIETLTLMGAGRWENGQLINLPGNYLVLKGEHILNFHFRYIQIKEITAKVKGANGKDAVNGEKKT